MNHLRDRLEAGFEAFGFWVARRRGLVTLLALAVAAALISQLPRATFDTSTEGFFHQNDPALQEYEAFRDQFGRDEMIIIAVETDDVFRRGFLERLTAFHEAVEAEVPYLDDLTSLVNARNTLGREDELIVEDLLEELPETPAEMAALRERVLTHPLYPNLLISEDGRFTTLLIKTRAYSPGAESDDLLEGFDDAGPAEAATERPPLTDAENSAVVTAARQVAERFAGPDFQVYVAGSPVVTDALKRAMQRDMMRFLGLAVAVIGLLLALLFRQLSGVVLPLGIVLLSLFSTLGLMATLGVPLKLPTTVLPSFLLAVGVGASVHLLTIFYRRHGQTRDRAEAMAHALGHSGLPIAMTSLTTAAGLLSFATAELAPIADLGRFAAAGVLFALFYTIVLLPALIAWTPVRVRPTAATGETRLDRALMGLGDLAARHPWPVAGITIGLIVLAAAGLGGLRFSHNTLVWFPQGTELREASDTIDRELKGSLAVEIVVDTGEENGLYDPETLHGIDRLAAFAGDYRDEAGEPVVGRSFSLADLVKEINRALNEDRPEAYALPDDRQLIAQELLLFENSGSDDLEDVADSLFSKARLTAKVAWDDAATYVGFVDDLQAQADAELGDGVETTVTGFLVLFTHAIDTMMRSTVVSYSIAGGVITLLMILLLGRVGIGLLSMIPNLTPIVFTLGIMGWLDIPLDMFTLLIGSIAIGLAVDDTIHFFHNYRRGLAATGDPRRAIHDTLLGTGRAMLVTTLVLVSGFWLFLFASLNNLFNFGLLTGITLAVALLADFLLAPALLVLIHRARRA